MATRFLVLDCCSRLLALPPIGDRDLAVADNEQIGSDVALHFRERSDDGSGADRHPGMDRRARTDPGPSPDADGLSREEGHLVPYGHMVLDDEVCPELEATAHIESAAFTDLEVLLCVAFEMGNAPEKGSPAEADPGGAQRSRDQARAHKRWEKSEDGFEQA